MQPKVASTPCNLSGLPSTEGTACWYSETRDGSTSYFVKWHITDPNFGIYMSFWHLTPKLWLSKSPFNGATSFHPIDPVKIVGSEITYDVTSYTTLSPSIAYDVYFCSYNSSGVFMPSEPTGIEHFISKCPQAPCNSDFSEFFSPHSSTDAALSFLRNYSDPFVSETWTLSDGFTIQTLNQGTTYLKPYGSYTLCHTITTQDDQGNTSTCTTCKTICCDLNGMIVYPGDTNSDCNAFFTSQLLSNGTNAILNVFAIGPPPPGVTDNYVVSNGSSTIYSGVGNISIIVPYGSYTICHTRTLADGITSCTYCT
ncbi:MAG: hypothetical protein JST36_01470, partial [Bacteroidetes bacterium]|nr:hypothetical protein [Bacteroidota bacterium]